MLLLDGLLDDLLDLILTLLVLLGQTMRLAFWLRLAMVYQLLTRLVQQSIRKGLWSRLETAT